MSRIPTFRCTYNHKDGKRESFTINCYNMDQAVGEGLHDVMWRYQTKGRKYFDGLQSVYVTGEGDPVNVLDKFYKNMNENR